MDYKCPVLSYDVIPRTKPPYSYDFSTSHGIAIEKFSLGFTVSIMNLSLIPTIPGHESVLQRISQPSWASNSPIMLKVRCHRTLSHGWSQWLLWFQLLVEPLVQAFHQFTTCFFNIPSRYSALSVNGAYLALMMVHPSCLNRQGSIKAAWQAANSPGHYPSTLSRYRKGEVLAKELIHCQKGAKPYHHWAITICG
jgi:hypothetical protein